MLLILAAILDSALRDWVDAVALAPLLFFFLVIISQ